MRTIRRTLACIAVLAAEAAAASPDPAVASREILAAEAAELSAWEARDIDAIMNAYAEDAIVMPGGAVMADLQALRAMFVAFLEDDGFTLTFRSDPPLVAASGEVGVTVGTYAVTFTHPESKEILRHTGRHLMTWMLQKDGQWRVVRQMTAHDRS